MADFVNNEEVRNGECSISNYSVPAPSVEEVCACDYPKWGPFLRPHTIKAKVIPLPMEFVEYLKEDGVFLPKDTKALPTRRTRELGEDAPWSDEEAEDEDGLVPDFAGLKAEIQAEIDALGGAVVPKLNWSSPKDAVWMTLHGNLRCENPDEVILLLKSSDAITHDIQHALQNCCDFEVSEDVLMPPPVLVLKKWYDIPPSSEFRCFVRRAEYLGACQRDTANFYPFMTETREELEELLLNFYDDFVSTHFPLINYTYDVHVTASKKVKILDFNPYGGETLPLLFDWDELEEMANKFSGARPDEEEVDPELCISPATTVDFQPPLRIIESQQQIRPGLRTGVPLDLYDTSTSGALAEFFEKHKEEHEKVKKELIPTEDDEEEEPRVV